MPELKITVVMPEADRQQEATALDVLMSALASEAGRLATLQRQQSLGQTAAPPRVFVATFDSAEALAALLRASGGWFMRHPSATVTYKMESSKGGKTLLMKTYSPVAMASAAAQLTEYLE